MAVERRNEAAARFVAARMPIRPHTPHDGPELILIGGGVNKKGSIYEHIAGRIRPGRAITLITLASEIGREVAENNRQAFYDLGVKRVHHLGRKTSRLEALDMFNDSDTGLYLGGDQLVGAEAIVRLGIEADLQDFVAENDYAVSSAGLAMVDIDILQAGEVFPNRGLKITRGLLPDTHYTQMNRQHRLRKALEKVPYRLGIGVDEDTAVRANGYAEVMGTGTVSLMMDEQLAEDMGVILRNGDSSGAVQVFHAGERIEPKSWYRQPSQAWY